MAKTWSHKEGTKGLDRVRVFERRPGGNLWIEWKNASGVKDSEAIRIGGKPVRDHALGIKIAKRVSEALHDGKRGTVLELLGVVPPRRLGELLDRLHAVRGPTWSSSHAGDQERYRKEWTAALGRDRLLTDIRADQVHEFLNRWTTEHRWKHRTRNGRASYLVTAFRFAQDELKWIREEHNLSAVKYLDLDQQGEPYEEWEIDLLLKVAGMVCPRLEAAILIACDTGRRVEAIAKLRVEDLTIEKIWVDGYAGEIELMRINFAAKNDKRAKKGWSYVTPSTRAAIERLMQTEAVEASGVLFPNRQNLTRKPSRNENRAIKPIRRETLIRMLHKAEALTRKLSEEIGGRGVESRHGRAFHGIKRTSVTAQARAASLEVAAKQAGTSPEVLRRIYHQAFQEDRAEMVVSLDERRKRRRERGTKASA